MTSNQRVALEDREDNHPSHIFWHMGQEMLNSLLEQIQERLVEECGYDQEEFDDDPLMEQLDRLE
jgi:hypothetical protein